MDQVSLGTDSTWEPEHWQTLGVLLQEEEWVTIGVSSQFVKTKPMPFKTALLIFKLLMLESLDFSRHEPGLVLGICLPSRKQKHL